MLHAAELEAGDDHEVVFVEGAGDAGIVFQPVQGLENQREDVVHLGRFRRIRLPVIDVQGFAGPDAGLLLPTAGRKGEEIGAQRRGLPESHPLPSIRHFGGRFNPVGDGFPPGRKFQRQGKPSLEVRLVETRECGPRPVRHEERVQIVIIAVEGTVSGDELHIDLVFSFSERAGRQDNVFVVVIDRTLFSVHFQADNSLASFPEVELDVRPPLQRKGDGFPAADWLPERFRNAEGNVIPDLREHPGPVLRQLKTHAFLYRRPGPPAREDRQGCNQYPDRADHEERVTAPSSRSTSSGGHRFRCGGTCAGRARCCRCTCGWGSGVPGPPRAPRRRACRAPGRSSTQGA